MSIYTVTYIRFNTGIYHHHQGLSVKKVNTDISIGFSFIQHPCHSYKSTSNIKKIKKKHNKEISKTPLCNFLSHNSDLCTWTCSFLKTDLLLKIMWMWLTSGRLPVEIVCKISSLTFRQNLNGEIVVLYIPHPSHMGTQTHYKQNSQ